MTTPSNNNNNNNTNNSDMRFGKFLIPSNHIFHRSPMSAAFVNLRPIVPGHVLVMPERIVATMEELSSEEYVDMWTCVRTVQGILKQHYQATAFNVAVQDGQAAGQSVPHVHVHILPRLPLLQGDDFFERNDDIYEELDAWAPRPDMAKPTTSIDVPEDEDREDRTTETMAEEAASYKRILMESF
jgi:diadenosine tetraphosphate (Ap4A) HIT family hydrolase